MISRVDELERELQSRPLQQEPWSKESINERVAREAIEAEGQ